MSISCPVCACTFKDDEDVQTCESCGTPHHKDCWEYVSGCAIYGCRKVIEISHESTEPSQWITNIGGTRFLPIRLLCWSLKLQWFLLIIAAYCFLIASVGALIFLVSQPMNPPSYSLHGFRYSWLEVVGSFIIEICGWASVIGAVGSLILLVPTVLLRRLALPHNSAMPTVGPKIAKKMADRMDLEDYVKYTRFLDNIFSKVVRLLFPLLIIAAIIVKYWPGYKFNPFFFLGSLLVLVSFRLTLLPLITGAVEGRIALVATYQNRLVATSKRNLGSSETLV